MGIAMVRPIPLQRRGPGEHDTGLTSFALCPASEFAAYMIWPHEIGSVHEAHKDEVLVESADGMGFALREDEQGARAVLSFKPVTAGEKAPRP